MGARADRAALGVSGPASPGGLALLVHEVKSPVAALESIRDAMRAAPIEARDTAELVHLALAACVALERIVREAPIATVQMRKTDLASILRETAAAAQLRGGRVRTPPTLALPHVDADPVRIRQALDNLVANALVHTAGADVILDACVEDESVVLTVTDHGRGIPASDQERIFEPGVRLDSSHPGSGLGLAVVKTIAEAHGGSVSVRSSPADGATFALVLPLPRA